MSKRFKLSPELGDGDHWTIANTPNELMAVIAEWADHSLRWGDPGDSFRVEVVDMTDDEVNRLPDI